MRVLLLLLVCCFAYSSVNAQPFKVDAEEQGLKNGVHWVKRTWYAPLNGTVDPDKSKTPDIGLSANQLIEYGKDGKLRSVMDYAKGSDETSGPTERYYWKDGRLLRRVRENDAYEVVTETTYTYDADGNEIKRETKTGPGDRTVILAAMVGGATESTWSGGGLATSVNRDNKGKLGTRTIYTYDAAGRKTKEAYEPAGLYSARTYEYGPKGSLITDTSLDREGRPSNVLTFEYNGAGKPIKIVASHFYQGKKDKETITTYSYNAQGDKISEKSVSDGKVTEYSWQHKYDAKKNRIQTTHIKAGKPEYIEVLELRYYQ